MQTNCGSCGALVDEGGVCAACGTRYVAPSGVIRHPMATSPPSAKPQSNPQPAPASNQTSVPPTSRTGQAEQAQRKTGGAGGGIVALLVIAAVVGGAIWYAMQPREQQPLALAETPAEATTEPSPAPEAPRATSLAEDRFADPIDGPMLREFRNLLPDDYARIVPPLLESYSLDEAEAFDARLSDELEAFQTANFGVMAAAEASALVDLAASIREMMLWPGLCAKAMGADHTPLPLDDHESRSRAAASTTAMLRAVASGRAWGVFRNRSDDYDRLALDDELRRRMPPRLWPFFVDSTTDMLSQQDRCTVEGEYWGAIAALPAEQAARLVASLFGGSQAPDLSRRGDPTR